MKTALVKAADRYFRALEKLDKATSPAWKARWAAASRAASLEYLTLDAAQESARAGKHH